MNKLLKMDSLNQSISSKSEEKKIGKTTYIVTSIFKENAEMTVVNKIAKLINTEAERLGID